MKKFVKYFLFIIIIVSVFTIKQKEIFAETTISNSIYTIEPGQDNTDNTIIAQITGTNFNSVEKGFFVLTKKGNSITSCESTSSPHWIYKNESSTNTNIIFSQNKFIDSGEYGEYTIKMCMKLSTGELIASQEKTIYINNKDVCSFEGVNYNDGKTGKVILTCPVCEANNTNIPEDFLKNQNATLQVILRTDKNPRGDCSKTTYTYKIKQNGKIVFSKAFNIQDNEIIERYIRPKGDYCENTGEDDCITCSVQGFLELKNENGNVYETIESDSVIWNCVDNNLLNEMWSDTGGYGNNNDIVNKCRNSLSEDAAVSVDPVYEITNGQTILKIKSGDCKDVPLKLSFNYKKQGLSWTDILSLMPGIGQVYLLYQAYEAFNQTVDIDDEINNRSDINEINFTPKDNIVTLTFITHDNGCFGGNDPDCIIVPRIRTTSDVDADVYIPDVKKLSSKEEEYGDTSSDSTKSNIIQEIARKGMILSECSTMYCSNSGNNWKFIDIKGAYNTSNSPTYVGTQQIYDPDNPCYIEDMDPETDGKQEGYDENCYELLAPFGGIENGPDSDMFKVQTDKNGVKRVAIKNIRDYELGNYINKIFQIAIAMLGVISVIMIIISGVQYMTEESIYGKSDAKQHIIGAISGLLLSLSIFVILKTINPKLLEVNFGEGINSVSIKQEDETVINNIIANDANFPPLPSNIDSGTLTTPGCPSVIKKVNGTSNTYVCETIVDNMSRLLVNAKNDGVNIGGGLGFRTIEQQEYLRRVNGCPDLYESPASKCTTPTAIPGQSMHNKGLAIDFVCTVDGKTATINTTKRPWTKVCFDWMKNNAENYGLKNLKSENWHWSTTGH